MSRVQKPRDVSTQILQVTWIVCDARGEITKRASETWEIVSNFPHAGEGKAEANL